MKYENSAVDPVEFLTLSGKCAAVYFHDCDGINYVYSFDVLYVVCCLLIVQCESLQRKDQQLS